MARRRACSLQELTGRRHHHIKTSALGNTLGLEGNHRSQPVPDRVISQGLTGYF
jgi:hypothetical protein